ncbi:hypothetical protein FHW83_002949 [Duganella sp. SG902]|uniref:hypothetical protein n=1 Tax=Duganella sp. SG902 TaxID=2587016 RepID=UPI00159E3174|nr:hypothetical protein [Duganella sp. SG902]NVM77143.1 hypothetical protein [Duganella sp. SG902]
MNSVESTKYRKTLEDGGVAPEQALAHADALGEALHNLQDTLATKEWVRAEFKEFKADILMWMVSLFMAQTTITVGAIIALIRALPH